MNPLQTLSRSFTAAASGSSFWTATNAANASDPLAIQDLTAMGILWAAGHPDWDEVNSTRWRSGRTSLTINLQELNL